MAYEAYQNLASQVGAYDASQRLRKREAKRHSRGMAATTAVSPSNITWRKSAERRLQAAQDTAKTKAAEKRQQRMIQLAKMPDGRGASEYKRIKEGGSLVETAVEKAARARQRQLAAMPKGRGKVTAAEDKNLEKQATKQEWELANRAKAGSRAKAMASKLKAMSGK